MQGGTVEPWLTEQLGGQDDLRILEVCEAEQRILVTFDRGFANVKAYALESENSS